jgi:hypothetical protein
MPSHAPLAFACPLAALAGSDQAEVFLGGLVLSRAFMALDGGVLVGAPRVWGIEATVR